MYSHHTAEVYKHVKQGLADIGYGGSLIQENYDFADIISPTLAVRTIPLAAFAHEPHSIRNACFGAIMANGMTGSPLVTTCRSLGAPQIFELHPHHMNRWKMTAEGEPQFLEQVMADKVPALFRHHKEDWSPARIMSAKSSHTSFATQLDFFDLGFLPLLEHQAREKLHGLLQNTIALSVREYQKHSAFDNSTYPPLFRLLFRLIAAKVFADRGYPGNWMLTDPQHVISSIQNLYFNQSKPESVLGHRLTQTVAWESIKNSFHFQNLSVDSLAYVYENTLVAPQTRKAYGIHSTPPAIAEYVTRRLPFEDLPMHRRRVFEPCAGHAVFLVAAMQRLRELLPVEMNAEQRHRYFLTMLSGIELDSFAREVAQLSLMLADYPNPNGWRIHAGDAFDSDLFQSELRKSQIVLCNPPFENFDSAERQSYKHLPSVRKPAAMLHQVLQRPPELLAFILPRSFVAGRSYRQLRTQIGQTYGSIDLLALPDKVFYHSDAEAVILMAHRTQSRQHTIRTSEVHRSDLPRFYRTPKLTREANRTFRPSETIFSRSIWIPDLQDIWKITSGFTKLGDVAEVHRGIEFNIPIRPNQSKLFSDVPQPDFQLGVQSVKNTVEPYIVLRSKYLNLSTENMRGLAYMHSWGKQKLIVNASRRTRGSWTITASIDYAGLVCYQNFHGVWLTTSLSLESMAAILNGPVANAFISTREDKRHIHRHSLLSIPIPDLDTDQDETICSLVNQYTKLRQQWLDGYREDLEAHDRCKAILNSIDAEVMKAYDLSPAFERSLLDYFAEQSRPGPVTFERYFPESFKPHIPWHRYLSAEMDEASAESTIARLPVIHDSVISSALDHG